MRNLTLGRVAIWLVIAVLVFFLIGVTAYVLTSNAVLSEPMLSEPMPSFP